MGNRKGKGEKARPISKADWSKVTGTSGTSMATSKVARQIRERIIATYNLTDDDLDGLGPADWTDAKTIMRAVARKRREEKGN